MQEALQIKRVALYARVSSEEQREGQNIDSQVAELERSAKQSGWGITDVYKDEGWSGSLLARPQLDRLRDHASKGLFEVVLINDVDRLARDVVHLGVIKRDLERQGVQVIFRKLPAEKSPTHNLMVNILGSFAEFERELIADRTRRGKRHKVEVRKQFLGSIAPYGYHYTRKDRAAGNEGILETNPEEAGVVRDIYKWVAEEGLSARKVVARLNELGIPPRKGAKLWARSSVLRILRSEVYAGVWYYNKFESCEPKNPVRKQKYQRSLKSSIRPRPRTEWLPVQLPEHLRLVRRDLWEQVQRHLSQNIVFSSRNSRHAYLLRSLVKCAGCGSRYVGEPCHGKFYYRCHARCKKVRTIKENDLDQAVWSVFREAILNPDLIIASVTKLTQSLLAQGDPTKGEVVEIQKASQQLRVEESRLLEAYRLEVISAAQLGTELEKLNARRTALESRKAELQEHPQSVPKHIIRDSVIGYCESIEGRLNSASVEERQRVLRLVVNDIIFDGQKVTIHGIIPAKGGPPRAEAVASSVGRIATTEIGRPGLNTSQDFGDNHDTTLNDSQVVPMQFSLERIVSKTQTRDCPNS
jgi:site-specific DNA recombinase